MRVLEAVRHPHKLRTGQLRGNRFRIVVRDVDDAACESAVRRLERACRVGDAQPLRSTSASGAAATTSERARAPAARASRRADDRRAARFLISALQAAVFNAVLAARETPLDALEPGDVAMVHESGGCFVVEDLAREAPRAARVRDQRDGPDLRDPDPRAARRGRRARARGDASAWESSPETCSCRGASDCGVPGGRCGFDPRRPRLEPIDGGLELRFTLPPGSYATVLVEELLAPETSCARRHG